MESSTGCATMTHVWGIRVDGGNASYFLGQSNSADISILSKYHNFFVFLSLLYAGGK